MTTPRPTPGDTADPAQAAANGWQIAGWVRVAATIALLAGLVFSRTVAVPLFAGALLALALTPVCGALCRAGLPRALAAVLSLGALIGTGTAAIYSVHGPLGEILTRGPDVVRLARHQVLDMANGSDHHLARNAQTAAEEQHAVVTVLAPVAARLTQALLVVGTSVVLSFFMLTSGAGVGRAMLVALSGKRERRMWLRVCALIRQQIGRYLRLVTLINIALGLAVAIMLWAMGVSDAAAYGVAAGLCNFVPLIGALVSAALILTSGYAAHGLTAPTLIPVGGFLCLHVLESQFVTPHLLGRRLLLNPLVVLLGLLIGAAAWGLGGAVLAVPILTSLKIAAAAHPGWARWGQVLGRGALIERPAKKMAVPDSIQPRGG